MRFLGRTRSYGPAWASDLADDFGKARAADALPATDQAAQQAAQAEAIRLRMQELRAQGHGPVTGSADDAYRKAPDGTPMTHKYGKDATRVNTAEGYVRAEEHLRDSQQFAEGTAQADAVRPDPDRSSPSITGRYLR